MIDDDARKLALDTAVSLLQLCPSESTCPEMLDDLMAAADRIFNWLTPGKPAVLVMTAGQPTEQPT